MIDDKLREIYKDWYGRGLPTGHPTLSLLISQTKQAFADEWLPKFLEVYNDSEHEEALITAFREAGYMTGQEWYDRFVKELPESVHLVRPDRDVFLIEWALDAAKKASEL